MNVCRDDSFVFDRLGLEASDRRNAIVVVVVISIIMLVFTTGPVPVQVVAAGIFGLVSGLCFIVATVLLHRVRSG
jgi:hypothetical protein